MKKTKKMAAALALSAALAMGAAPAFAADASVGKTGSFADGNDNTGSASTALNVYATASQIQATIPVDITIVTPIEGGTITAPSADAYKIVNNNATKGLKVTKVQGVDNAGWKAVTELTNPKNNMSATTGEMKLTVKAGSSAAMSIESENATSIPTEAQSYFTAPANGELGLELAGTTSVKSNLTANTTYPAVKITYTVAVDTPAA